MSETKPISHQTQGTASLLLLDAQVNARSALADDLRRHGYSVDEAGSGDDALAFIRNGRTDLAILDVALPSSNGAQILKRIREAEAELPIIVLTAHATIESAVAAVKLNVVDYMFKPCKTEDLILTITRALEERAQQQRHQRLLALVGDAMDALRQPEKAPPSAEPRAASPAAAPVEAPSSGTLEVGILALDRHKRQATLNTDPRRTVDLTEGELSILIALMEKPNHVFSYNDLARTALGYEGMDKWTVESVIRSTVFRLRHKIEPGPDTPNLIRTVRGRGYFFSPA
ncbi:MAG: response regulator transcription factor [Chloroflexi bacterium]|nr:response regulator transcription factor [Chloroflexota bacterium]